MVLNIPCNNWIFATFSEIKKLMLVQRIHNQWRKVGSQSKESLSTGTGKFANQAKAALMKTDYSEELSAVTGFGPKRHVNFFEDIKRTKAHFDEPPMIILRGNLNVARFNVRFRYIKNYLKIYTLLCALMQPE